MKLSMFSGLVVLAFSFAASAQARPSAQSLVQSLASRLPMGSSVGTAPDGSKCQVIAGTLVDEDPNELEQIKVQVVDSQNRFVDGTIYVEGHIVGVVQASAVALQKGQIRISAMKDSANPANVKVTVQNGENSKTCSVAAPTR